MSQDWQIGDLAVCIDASDLGGAAPQASNFLAEGRVYRVVGVGLRGRWHKRFGYGIALAETKNPFGPSGAFSETRFRKILPDEHESCEEEFVTLLKLSKQRVSA